MGRIKIRFGGPLLRGPPEALADPEEILDLPPTEVILGQISQDVKIFFTKQIVISELMLASGARKKTIESS